MLALHVLPMYTPYVVCVLGACMLELLITAAQVGVQLLKHT